ncbi:MAG: DUF427 domain-containing protein [Acidimicrobiia bacterium]|nr:DUF427 domain-containing protein [Acidimicrobiia bacterium]
MMTDRGRVRVEPGAKRVRAMLDGQYVADTTTPLLVWEKPYYPTYYIPLSDIADGVLVDSGQRSKLPSRGEAVEYAVVTQAGTRPDAAYAHPESPIQELRSAVALRWDAMDHWFEEDEEVFVHPRDPYKRVDVLRSSRTVRVEIDGVTVAESSNPTLLFETSLPTRYYLPMTDVRMDLLTPTDTVTSCPYKGDANYWSVGERRDIAWGYRFPVRESQGIEGLVCFYNEKVDITVDGVAGERPNTVFS